MATRKHRRIRTRRRKQRGGNSENPPDNRGWLKRVVNGIKGWLGKSTTPDPTKPSSTAKLPLLSPSPSTGSVAINVKNTPPPPAVNVKKPLIPLNSGAASGASQSGGPVVSSQSGGPVVPSQSGGPVVPSQSGGPIGFSLPGTSTALGGRRKKHRHTRRRLRK